MPKFLSIDYGKKRTGIAITDSQNIIASPLTTVETSNLNSFLKNITDKEDITKIIVGDPKNLDNSSTDISTDVDVFTQNLIKIFQNIQVIRIDERFTSKMAKQAILMSGVNKKRRQDKKLVDQVSAAIILQSYLSQLD
ncbi:MAG: Holliday junction resolvase RuvX [Flavobacteriales bacterium]|nr:Holliday junction resolvase RuvX [Flavobacteriales bacterium]